MLEETILKYYNIAMKSNQVKNEIADIIKRFTNELKKEGIDIIKVFLFGSYSRGTEHIDSDIDVAVVCKDFDVDPIEQNMRLWKIAVRVDTRIAPISLSVSEFQKEYIPIVTEIKNGLDLTAIAA
jgi:predicted nucleotidyltransferase